MCETGCGGVDGCEDGAVVGRGREGEGGREREREREREGEGEGKGKGGVSEGQ